MSTVFASITTPGPPGPPGRTGLWLTGAVPPVTAQGLDGDMYLNSSNGDVYGPKSGVWGSIVANIKGATGATGLTGPAGYSPLYIVAAGVPSAGTGNNGDMYLNSATSDIYGPKTAGAWGAIVANIKGATGATGPPGTAYTPMGAWVSTTSYAQGHEVTDGGILYISLQSGNLNHVPLSNPTWWAPLTGGGGGSQTPWLSNIDGANKTLFNVGQIAIGLSAPLATLHVRAGANQNLQIGSMAWAFAGAVGINAVNDANAATIPLVFNASNSVFYGKVGIETTAPVSALEVVGRSTFSANGDPFAVGIRYSATSGYFFIGASNAASLPDLIFSQESGTERMRITAAGNVGIGTAAPEYSLHVAGRALITPASEPYAIGLRYNASSTQAWIGLTSGGALQISDAAGTGHVWMTQSGNVGIGTASPINKFVVSNGGAGGFEINPSYATGGATGAYIVSYDRVANAYRDIILDCGGTASKTHVFKAGGNVGIGTTVPAALLHVAADATRQLYLTSGSTPSSSQMRLGYDVSNNTAVVEAFNGGSPTYLLLNPTSGAYSKVGIGTIAPQGQVAINPGVNAVSVATANFLTLGEATNSSGYYMSMGYFLDGGSIWKGSIQALVGGAAGNLVLNGLGGGVAVGKVGPISYALDVAGDVNCSGAFRVNGTPISTGGSGGVTVQTAGMAGSSRLIGNTYQNTFSGGKPVLVTVTCNCNAAGSFWANCNSTNSFGAGNQVAQTTSQNASQVLSITFWVLPNYFYQVSSSGSLTLTYWTEWY